MAEQSPTTFGFVLRLLTVAMMASLVIVLGAVTAILVQRDTDRPPVWPFLVLLAVLVGEKLLIRAIGYRFTPIAPGTEENAARLSSISQVQRLTIVRLALSEIVAFAGIALAFIVGHGGVFVSAAGVLAAEIVIFFSMWPREALVARTQEALEREGGLSYLRESLDAPPPGRTAS